MIISFSQIGLYIVMIVVYAPYGTRPPKKDIKLFGISTPIAPNIDDDRFSTNVVIEYEYIKKITYVALPFFIVLTSASFIDHNIRIPALLLTEYPFTASFSPVPISIYQVLSSLWAALFFVVSGVLLRMLLWLGRKEFRYYFARGCAKIGQHEYGVRQIRYLILALDSYNKYLQRYLKIQINDKVYPLIALQVLADKTELTSIYNTFESNDELYPAQYLSRSQKISLPPNEQFLVESKQTVRQTIIEWGAVAAAVIPLLATIIKEFALK